MQKLVIYHGGCSDGWCSAWLLKRAYPDAELFQATYGDPPPDVRGKQVYVVDFSYPRAEMLRMFQQADGNVVVLDHHATARDALADICVECVHKYPSLPMLPSVVFDMGRSGAMLTLDYLGAAGVLDAEADGKVRWLVELVQDRDLWQWKLPESKAINAAIRSYPQTMEVWNELLFRSPDVMRVEGAAILRDQQQTIDAHVRLAWEQEVGGHNVLVVNATTLASEIAGTLAVGRPFGAVFNTTERTRKWSLRSSEDGIDVSQVAKLFGGGGHKHAAGFTERFPY